MSSIGKSELIRGISMHKTRDARLFILIAIACWFSAVSLKAQDPSLTIDLKNALEQARLNSPQFQSSSLAVESARIDRYLAKVSFYPTAGYVNQYTYTQGNGTPSGVFISNDGVHVYNSQVNVHQEIYAPGRLSEYRRSIAAEAAAAAKRDVVLRGVVSVVFQDYYAIALAQRRLANARQSLKEAQQFVDISSKLERGGEVAHSDSIKALLALDQREREAEDARFSVEKSKIALAVLMFRDSIPEFSVVDDLDSILPLAPFNQVETLAKETNPDLRAAQQTLRQEQYGVSIAKSSYYPSFSLDYFYGINNNEFATHDEEGANRLGSVAQATLNIPIFSWWTNRSKVRQAELKQEQAQLEITLAARELSANLRAGYLEAQSARNQLDSLRRTLELAKESLRLTNLRYEAGEVTVLEVVDAQSTLAQSRNACDDGLARYRLALANIQTLTGSY
jgi:outer membrane protein TolC